MCLLKAPFHALQRPTIKNQSTTQIPNTIDSIRYKKINPKNFKTVALPRAKKSLDSKSIRCGFNVYVKIGLVRSLYVEPGYFESKQREIYK